MKTIGRIINNRIEKEYYRQGYVYKNFDAYNDKTDEVCYVPEHSGEENKPMEAHLRYTYQDFEYLAKEFIANNPEVYDWVKRSGYTSEIIANELFLSLDWQMPITLIKEWEKEKNFTI
jgi:hypothetical protein